MISNDIRKRFGAAEKKYWKQCLSGLHCDGI